MKYTSNGKIINCEDSSTNEASFEQLKRILNKSIRAGTLVDKEVVSTYSLIYTVANAYFGGVLSPNGDIHFIPYSVPVGQKVSTLPAIPLSLAVCCSPFFNKL